MVKTLALLCSGTYMLKHGRRVARRASVSRRQPLLVTTHQRGNVPPDAPASTDYSKEDVSASRWGYYASA